MHLGRRARQQQKQVEFGAGELQRFALALCSTRDRIHFQTLESQRPFQCGRRGRGRAHAPQHGLQPCHQFARLERLGQIVIRPQFQPDHAVHHVAPCRQHHDRQFALAPDGAAQFEAVHFRQHHVEDGGIETAGTQQAQSFRGCKRLHQFQPKTTEIGRQRRPQIRIVIDQQNACHVAHCDIPVPT